MAVKITSRHSDIRAGKIMNSDRNESAKGNILIVDDAPENIRLLSAMLQQANYEVMSAKNGIDALEIAKSKSLDVILIGVNIPELNGYEVCSQLKAIPETIDIPVILLGSSNNVADIVRGFEVGGADYISEPLEPLEVLARVKVQVAQRKSKQELAQQNQLLQAEISHHLAAVEVLKKAKEELELLNRVDGLTLLSNRNYFDEYLEGNWRQMQREATLLSLIICDIDLFHGYSEVYGHEQSDRSLQAFAQAIVKSLKRPGDISSRYGDDEFRIVLPKTDASGAITVAKHIQKELQNLAIAYSKSPTGYLTVSMGVSTAEPTQQQSSEILLATAASALYQAKQEGRNLIIFKLANS